MRALIFSDLHNHTYQEFSTLVEGTNSRLLEHISCMDRIIQDGIDYQVDVFAFTGDVFHLKNYIDSQVIRMTMERFQKMAAVAPLIMCPGNHDYKGWNNDPVLLEVLREFVLEVHMGDTVPIKGWTFCIFPYTRNVEILNEKLIGLNHSPKSIGLFHQDIVGQMYGKFLVEKGLNSNVLANLFDFSFVGHFHNQKQIEPNVWSVGSPLMLNFSESDHQKGWLIFDTDVMEVLPIINNESPKFRIAQINSEHPVNLEEVFGHDSLQKDFFRIEVLGGKQPDLSSIKWKRVKVESAAGKKKRTDLSFSDSNSAIIQKYVKARHGSLDEKALIEVGMRYLS